MKKIVFTRADGGVSIVIPASKESIEKVLGEMSDEEYTQHVIQRSIPEDATNVRMVDDSDIPEDRTFRDAWTDDNPTNTIDVDMTKAREIHMGRIRSVRDEKLKELDVEQLKGNDVFNKKQTLRDIPQNFDLTNATTPEQLKQLWPDELK